MSNKRDRYKRIKIDDGFDEDVPMARAVRAALPPDSIMDEDARERTFQHLLTVQRSARRNRTGRYSGRDRTGRYSGWNRDMRSRAFRPGVMVPAMAVLLVLIIGCVVILPTLLEGGSKPSPLPQASYARFINLVGDVQVKVPGMAWREADQDNSIAEGWAVRTGSGTAAVSFPDGSIARVTDGTVAKITRINSQEVAITHLQGGTYHRVHKGTRYSVTFNDITSRAVGTAFNIDNRQPGKLEILTVESAVEVSIGKHEPIKVSEGEVMRVSLNQDKKADKQNVSLERLQEGRLMSSVQQDAQAGYPTGIYETAGVQETAPQSAPVQTDPQPSIVLDGTIGNITATLNWALTGTVNYSEYVLLRTEGAEPVYPDNEIAKYSDMSITSSSDNSLQAGHTYQYRMAGIEAETGNVILSNTVLVTVPQADTQPTAVILSITAAPRSAGISVEWTVSGASTFDGFTLERVVEKAPDGSATPVGSTSFNRFATTDVFYSYLDNSVMPGHTYSYRVGLVLDDSAMAYSDWAQVEFTRK